MDAQAETRTEERYLLLSRTKFSLEWVRHGNQVEPIISFDGESVGFVRDLHVGVDVETGLPILTLSVLAPGLSIIQKDVPFTENHP